jgi:hypothetical protein
MTKTTRKPGKTRSVFEGLSEDERRIYGSLIGEYPRLAEEISELVRTRGIGAARDYVDNIRYKEKTRKDFRERDILDFLPQKELR